MPRPPRCARCWTCPVAEPARACRSRLDAARPADGGRVGAGERGRGASPLGSVAHRVRRGLRRPGPGDEPAPRRRRRLPRHAAHARRRRAGAATAPKRRHDPPLRDPGDEPHRRGGRAVGARRSLVPLGASLARRRCPATAGCRSRSGSPSPQRVAARDGGRADRPDRDVAHAGGHARRGAAHDPARPSGPADAPGGAANVSVLSPTSHDRASPSCWPTRARSTSRTCRSASPWRTSRTVPRQPTSSGSARARRLRDAAAGDIPRQAGHDLRADGQVVLPSGQTQTNGTVRPAAHSRSLRPPERRRPGPRRAASCRPRRTSWS